MELLWLPLLSQRSFAACKAAKCVVLNLGCYKVRCMSLVCHSRLRSYLRNRSEKRVCSRFKCESRLVNSSAVTAAKHDNTRVQFCVYC